MKYVLGIDVGGTKIAAGLVDKNLKLNKVAILPTSQTDLVGQLIRLIEDYSDFEAIGLAVPGQVQSSGMVTRLPNVQNFRAVNLRTLLEKKFKVPVTVLNDAKSFAFAEAMVGLGKNSKTIAGVILGTGVGVGIVIDGQIYYGKDGIAGEFERVSLLDGKMFRNYRHEAGIFKKASESKKFLRMLFGMIVLSFNPDLIVLGGSWSKLSGMEKLANELTQNVGGYINKTQVKVSKLKHAGVLGAALLALKK